jgi:hypothetical protein|tara:strand:+ start:6647 stop:6868 length:222 start_codon:yes stop_codon:yes gene_type:complete
MTLSTTQSDIDTIKSEIQQLEKDYKNSVDNVEKSKRYLEDTENTYNYFLFYTISISLGTLYLTRFLYLKMMKK